MEKKRRPPSLSDAIFVKGDSASSASGDFRIGVTAACRGELQRSVSRLRADVDAALQRHQYELSRCAEVCCAARLQQRSQDGWHSAGTLDVSSVPVLPLKSAGSDSKAYMPWAHSDLPGCSSSATTPTIQPPRKGVAPVVGGSGEEHLQQIVRHRLRLAAEETDNRDARASSPESLSTTRTTAFGVDGFQDISDKFNQSRSRDSSDITISYEAAASSGGALTATKPPLKAAWLGRGRSFDGDSTEEDVCGGSEEVSPSNGHHLPQQAFAHAVDSKKRTRSKSVVFSPLSKHKLEVIAANQSKFERSIRSHSYELVSSVFIIANAMFIIWETDRRARLAFTRASDAETKGYETYFATLAFVFCTIFVVDLSLRISVERWRFFHTSQSGWNVFDIFVTLTQAMEVTVQVFEHFTSSSATTSHARMFLRKFAMLRIVRLLRIVKMTRAIRIIRVIRELRLMVFSLAGAWKSFCWAVVLLLIVLMVFSVFFTDGTLEYCLRHDAIQAEDTKELRQRFGTLSAAMVSLYMAMSGGEDWATILSVLDPLPYEYRLLFLWFITFGILALMNVVTAVFVGTAMQRSQCDREMVVQQEIEQKGEFVMIMQQVFDELDTNNSGALSLSEFEKHIEDERVMAYLRTLEIEVSQVRTLFTLLDVDKTGEVDIEEFVGGCLRLRGGATNMDLAVLKYQVEAILRNVQSLHQNIVGSRCNSRAAQLQQDVIPLISNPLCTTPVRAEAVLLGKTLG